ncbi:hypothetical protein ACFX2J_032157 [Malus domestica]
MKEVSTGRNSSVLRNELLILYKNQHLTGFQRSKRRAQKSKRPIQKSKRRWLSQKLGLLRNHGPSSIPNLSTLVTCNLCTRRSSEIEEASSEIGEAFSFPDMSAPVTCTLSLAEITGNLSKISGDIERM